MTEPEPRNGLHWLTIAGPAAHCTDPACTFVYHGDGDRTAAQAANAARRHARATGHDTVLQRGQISRRITP